jgi:hypothetical protein
MLPHLPDIRNKYQMCANIDNDKKCQYSSGTLTSEKSIYIKENKEDRQNRDYICTMRRTQNCQRGNSRH